MNYFTPELIALGKSEDHSTLNEQERLWDEACDRYEGYLASVRTEMPAGLRHIFDSYYLHDARVQGMGWQGRSFVIVLQLDTPPHALLTLGYDLVEDARITHEALPLDGRSAGSVVEWQYDEVERVAGTPATWRQSILLSNGWEVTLHFRDVQVQEIQALLPAPALAAVAHPMPVSG